MVFCDPSDRGGKTLAELGMNTALSRARPACFSAALAAQQTERAGRGQQQKR